jgi:AcrR family transcriptional regulator
VLSGVDDNTMCSDVMPLGAEPDTMAAVVRWEPGAEQRLQAAAMALFQQRGYDNVTVAEIAQSAGLTRRTFFNYFADKREIFSSGATAFHDNVIASLEAVEARVKPLDAAAAALVQAGIGIGQYREHAGAVRVLVESSTELYERELAKMASVGEALAEGLAQRGAEPRIAQMAASCAVTAYRVAWRDWGERPDGDFAELMRNALADLRTAVRGTS